MVYVDGTFSRKDYQNDHVEASSIFSVFYKKESCRRNEEEISKQHGVHYGLYISPYFQVAALFEFLF